MPYCSFDEENDDEVPEEENSDLKQYVNDYIEVETEEKIVGTDCNYTIPFSRVKNVDFVVKWTTGNNDYWIDYENSEPDKYDVTINIEHPFFMPFSKDETFKRVLEKFTLALFFLKDKQKMYLIKKDMYQQML